MGGAESCEAANQSGDLSKDDNTNNTVVDPNNQTTTAKEPIATNAVESRIQSLEIENEQSANAPNKAGEGTQRHGSRDQENHGIDDGKDKDAEEGNSALKRDSNSPDEVPSHKRRKRSESAKTSEKSGAGGDWKQKRSEELEKAGYWDRDEWGQCVGKRKSNNSFNCDSFRFERAKSNNFWDPEVGCFRDVDESCTIYYDLDPNFKKCREYGCFACSMKCDGRYMDIAYNKRDWHRVRYCSKNTLDGWLRVSFPRIMCAKINGMAAMDLIQENTFDNIQHLAISSEEALLDCNKRDRLNPFSIWIIGQILEQYNRYGIGDNNQILKTFHLDGLLLVGNQSEFDHTFDQLSRCGSILEFVFRNCAFHPPNGNLYWDGYNSDRSESDCEYGDADERAVFHQLQSDKMMRTLNAMKSLEVIVIENTQDTRLDDTFASTVLRNHEKNKAIKLLQLSHCILPDSLITAMFGLDSRVEQFILRKTPLNSHNLPTVANLLQTENRTMQLLELPEYIPISEALRILEALGENNVLKHLKLCVNYGTGDNLNWLRGTVHSDVDDVTVHSIVEAIGNLVGLETLALNFDIIRDWWSIEGEWSSQHELALYEVPLRQINLILRNGLIRNETIKVIDFEAFVNIDYCPAKFKTWISDEVNKNLILAVFNSSSPRLSTITTDTGIVLQEFSFAVNFPKEYDEAPTPPPFEVQVNPEIEFLLAFNRAGIRKLLQQPDEFQSWRDAIIENSGNPSIVYYIVRQKPGLLMKSIRGRKVASPRV